MARSENDEAGRSGAPLVILEGITKRFPGVVANDGVDLTLYEGEVHALVGENGAGKSTLMRVLYGLYPPDEGQILVRGKVERIASPRHALDLGIGMVHQHFMLVDRFTVTENIVLGAEGRMIVDQDGARTRIKDLGTSYGFKIDPDAVVEDLSVGQEQRVEILKTLYRDIDLLILDEPTAVLTPAEANDLFTNLQRLREDGKTIVFISHKLDEVLHIADRITVLRRGKVVGETRPAETSKEKLAEMMVGRPVLFRVDRPSTTVGQPILRLENVTLGSALNDVTFDVKEGEIVGIAGVEGNGQIELAESVVGLRQPDSGRVIMGDKDITTLDSSHMREISIAYIPEDRHGRGLVLDMTLWENTLLGRQNDPGYANRAGVLAISKVKEISARLIKLFDVRARNISVEAETLSGGNQQKLILAREIDEEPALLVAHQPTRGLDVGAIEFVWKQILEQKAAGRSVLLISAELDEIFALSDRILTLYEGRVTGEYTPDASREEVGLGMTGKRKEAKAS